MTESTPQTDLPPTCVRESSTARAATTERRVTGRPYGAKTPVLAGHQVLHQAHFSYIRFAIHGFTLRDAWLRCLAFAGGTLDERHFRRRLREVCTQIRVGAAARDLASFADVALRGLSARWRPLDTVPAMAGAVTDEGFQALDLTPEAARVQTLDEWIDARCDELGIEADFQTQADWLNEYQDEFGLEVDQEVRTVAVEAASPMQRAAMRWADEAGDQSEGEGGDLESRGQGLRAQLAALNQLATLLAVPPQFDDSLQIWLAPELCKQLRQAGVLTLANLADYVDLYRYRWHVRIAGLGAVRAARLVKWIAPLVNQLGRPLREVALRPERREALTRARQLALLDPIRLQRYGLVPLERLAVPPELSGRHGTFRVAGPNSFGAEDDLAAIKAWLQRYALSPRTYRAYFHAVEVFYLWCLWVRRKPLSSLIEADLHALRDFVSAPPADWVQPRRVDRASDEWRPFRGALSPRSQQHIFTVIGALYRGLVDAGYVSMHAVSGVKPHWKLPRASINVRRSFNEAQWACVMAALAAMPATAFTRRLRLVLELGATTGLRLIELCTARMGDLRNDRIDGAPVWLLHVVGKGRRERDVVIFDDVKAMIDGHQVDMAQAGIGFDPRASLRTLGSVLTPLPAAGVPLLIAGSEAPQGNPKQRPLIGALRKPVPRWGLDALGVAALDRTPRQGDAYGGIDPSALYQVLKRLFARAAEQALLAEPPLDAAVLRSASTHWLRHFFANNAIDDGVKPSVLRDGMGHSDLRTTSVYIRAEERALVAEMSKMRRRG